MELHNLPGLETERRIDRVAQPFFSICIPQYNRTSFLLEALRSFAAQTFKDFEVCISDDCSTDGRASEILEFLQASGLSFVYRRQERNSRYDANLRASIALARGEYCLLLGNDDGLTAPDSLAIYREHLLRYAPVGVATCNFVQAGTGTVIRRVKGTRKAQGGPATAAKVYRNFSFVGGVVLRRERAQAHATDRWDGGEMYQTFLASRIIAEGNDLLNIDDVLVNMGLVIAGESVDSVFRRERLDPCPIIERRIPLAQMARIVSDAIGPYMQASEWPRLTEWIIAQLYLFPYPYWLLTYRRIQSRRYSLGIALGMRPRVVAQGIPLPIVSRIRLLILYVLASTGGLILPLGVFDASKGPLLR